MSKLPDLEGLAIFAKVVQTRSFVGAADELRLSKATVSKAISRIEKKFGTRLFNRTARRLAVTEAGRQLYERAAHILAEGEAAEDEGIAQSAVPRGRVRLTAPISFGVLHIGTGASHLSSSTPRPNKGCGPNGPTSTANRIAIAAVCHPQAASPLNVVPSAAASSRW